MGGKQLGFSDYALTMAKKQTKRGCKKSKNRKSTVVELLSQGGSSSH